MLYELYTKETLQEFDNNFYISIITLRKIIILEVDVAR